MFVALAAVLALSAIQDPAAGAAAAETPAVMTEAERAAAEEEARRNEVVCRREHVVGTNRPQRICMTRGEWERISDNSREALREDRFQTGQGRGPGEGVG